MRSLFVALLLASSAGCIVTQPTPQQFPVRLLPLGENTLLATDGEGPYTVELEHAGLHFTAVRVIPTTVLIGDVTLDSPIVDITQPGSQPLSSRPDPAGVPLDYVEVELKDAAGVSLFMIFAVKLSDGSKVRGELFLPISDRVISSVPSALINLGGGLSAGIDIIFDKSRLLDGVDFDAVAGCFDEIPAKSAAPASLCRDFVIDTGSNKDLLPLLEQNLAAAFIDVRPSP